MGVAILGGLGGTAAWEFSPLNSIFFFRRPQEILKPVDHSTQFLFELITIDCSQVASKHLLIETEDTAKENAESHDDYADGELIAEAGL